LEPEKPKNKEILRRIALTPGINQPLAAAARYSKGGNFRSGSAAGKMKYRAGSSTESKDEDDEDPPVVIDKSKKSSSTQQRVGLGGNLSKGCKAPLVTHRRGRTDHDNRRSSRLEIESAEAD
jgi:hypothetical protein